MTSGGTLFSVGATPHQIPLSQRQNHFGLSSTCLRHGLVTFIKFPYKLTVPGLPLCSSSSSNSTTTIVEDELSPVTSESEAQEDSSSPMLPLRGCQACGREEIERGCNGEGRIQGGIAAVPGFGWWPIKAYRPCPGFLASGGRYRRQGQSMDEVAFGRGERGAPLNDSDSSKKKQGPRKFKR